MLEQIVASALVVPDDVEQRSLTADSPVIEFRRRVQIRAPIEQVIHDVSFIELGCQTEQRDALQRVCVKSGRKQNNLTESPAEPTFDHNFRLSIIDSQSQRFHGVYHTRKNRSPCQRCGSWLRGVQQGRAASGQE